MKKLIGILAVIAFTVVMATPVSASSLGISPSHIEIEVPSGGSTPVNFQVHYFTGELRVSLVDIPLELEKEVYDITSDGEEIVVTFHDTASAPQEYNGYVKFLGLGNNTIGLSVKVAVSISVTANIVEQPSPAPSGGNGGAPSPPPTYSAKADLFGTEETFTTNSQGEVQKTVEATSGDGALTLTIPEGTVALGEDGKRLSALETVEVSDPPSPPEDKDIVGLPYDFGPDGATFDPPMTLSWEYGDLDPANLVIAYYDVGSDQWVELPCKVDYENGVIVAEVAHFTIFAMLEIAEEPVVPEEPAPAPTPPTPPPAPPIPEPPAEPPELLPAPAPEAPEVTTPAVAPVEPEAPVVTPEAPPWGLIIGLIAATIIVGIAIWLIRRRRD